MTTIPYGEVSISRLLKMVGLLDILQKRPTIILQYSTKETYQDDILQKRPTIILQYSTKETYQDDILQKRATILFCRIL